MQFDLFVLTVFMRTVQHDHTYGNLLWPSAKLSTSNAPMIWLVLVGSRNTLGYPSSVADVTLHSRSVFTHSKVAMAKNNNQISYLILTYLIRRLTRPTRITEIKISEELLPFAPTCLHYSFLYSCLRSGLDSGVHGLKHVCLELQILALCSKISCKFCMQCYLLLALCRSTVTWPQQEEDGQWCRGDRMAPLTSTGPGRNISWYFPPIK